MRARLAPRRRGLATHGDVQGIAPLLQERSDDGVVVTLVAAEVLLASTSLRPRPSHGETLQRLPHQTHVMNMGARDGQGERYAVSIRKKGTLGAGLGAVRRIRAGFSPHPAGPSSSLHRGSANPSRSLSVRRTPRAPPSRAGRTPPSPSIPGSSYAACWDNNRNNRIPSEPPSIGSRSAGRREFHLAPAADRRAVSPPACPCDTAAAAARRGPTARPERASSAPASCASARKSPRGGKGKGEFVPC